MIMGVTKKLLDLNINVEDEQRLIKEIIEKYELSLEPEIIAIVFKKIITFINSEYFNFNHKVSMVETLFDSLLYHNRNMYIALIFAINDNLNISNLFFLVNYNTNMNGYFVSIINNTYLSY